MSEQFDAPGGYVVVLFGSDADGWCSLNKCPMGHVRWFADEDQARRYADSMPEAFEPHILLVERPPGYWLCKDGRWSVSGHGSAAEALEDK